MKTASILALQKIVDPQATKREKQSAWYFVIAMLPRAARTMQSKGGTPTKNQEAKSKLKQLADISGDVVKVDKGIDALQEAFTEAEAAGDWMTEVWTQIASGNFGGLLP
ncbi:MAG: hypothetical protein AAGF60_08445 [Pseudomonadota bacterium]